ncbi:MAG TPA: hypothetical protein VGE79_01335, partial [Niastella sp.]
MTSFSKQSSTRLSSVLSIFLCLFLSINVSAQINGPKGVISGQIITVDNEPAEGVAVKVSGPVEKQSL